MKYHIKTFGCQMNHSDSERITALLEKYKFKKTADIAEADLVVFNTCGVRQMAEDRVYGQIHNLVESRKLKVESQKIKVKIILTGCLANRKDVQRRLKDKVDLFCEIKDLQKKLTDLLFVIASEAKQSRSNCNNSEIAAVATLLRNDNKSYLEIIPKHTNDYQAYVPILTGCNNFCSYCVVPYARGREISRPAAEIIEEIQGLVKKGYKEIILLGQNVNSYCDKRQETRDMSPVTCRMSHVTFSDLLKKINALPGKFRVSFVSNHPKDVTDEMIETVAKCKKVCESFHLPLQSGNDQIIQKMNRHYTQAQYLKIINKIKSAFKKYKPGLPYSITSDIIVGFPGETKKQFLDSAKVMQKAKFDMVFFGQFSARPGTVAAKMKDNVSKDEKARREKYLNEILKKTTHANNKKYMDKTLEVLVEKQEALGTKSPIGDLVPKIVYFGKTRTMKNVKIVSNQKNLVGKIVKVKIIKANVWNLEAEAK